LLQFSPRGSNGGGSLAPILRHRLSKESVHSFERWALPFLVQHRHDLANLTLEFLDLSLAALSGVTVKMTDNGRALFRTKPQELLAGEGKALACFSSDTAGDSRLNP
jgi:hypothetical protein